VAVWAVLFAVVAAVLCVAAVLAMLAVAHVGLSGAEAIERDGLARGALAPAWSLPDSAGRLRASPPAGPLQLVLFADHSLKSFPSVVAGLREVMAEPDAPEAVVLLRQSNERAEPVLSQLGLAGLPVVAGSPALYGRYNVRVAPFCVLVDSGGRVRASSLVNHDWQVTRLVQLARLPLDPAELRGRARLRRRPAVTAARSAAPAPGAATATGAGG
jgi:hypothetical protein